MNNRERIVWIDSLKILSILIMILLHVSAFGLKENAIGSFDWHVSNIYNSLSRACVPLFIMISGALFLSREVNTKKYIMRIIISIIFWTLAYTFYVHSIPIFKGDFSFEEFLLSTTKASHLWFLFMILGIYIVIPLLRQIIKENSLEKYFIILWILFSIILPSIENITVIQPYVHSFLSQTHFTFALEYTGYFILGHYLYHNNHQNIEKYCIVYIFLGIISTILGSYFVAKKTGGFSPLFYDNLFPTTFLTAIGIFILFKNHVSKLKFKTRTKKLINSVAAISLGIYAIHMFYLVAFHSLNLSSFLFNSAISMILITIATFILSLCTIYLLKKYVPIFRHVI